MAKLTPLRAPGHRDFIGPDFGGRPAGEDPHSLSYAEIISDPRLAGLGNKIFHELRKQFAAPDPTGADDPATERYRRKLEGWADMLETLLEETLADLEALDGGGQPGADQSQGQGGR